MRTAPKDLCLASMIVVVVGAVWLVMRSIGPTDLGVRVIGRTNNPAGGLQIIYEITNRTSKDVIFALASVETRSATGWRVAARTQGGQQRELRITRMLGRRSAAAVRIITGTEDTAVRGVVEYQKDDRPLRAKMRMLARRAGLPRYFWAPPDSVFGDHPVGLIRLPELETSGHQFLLATSAEGVWPEPPFEPPHHNFYVRGNPATVLDAYRALSGATVTIDPSVPLYGASVTVEPTHDLQEPSEVIRLIEDALREQAGIVVTQRGSNSVTFTWAKGAKLGAPR